MSLNAALIYSFLVALPVAMHIGVASGAPWGRFTVGGRFADTLPPLWRGLALVQASILCAMAVVMLDRGGIIALGIAEKVFWGCIGVTALSTLANAISPSRAERLLWTPVLVLMTGSSVALAVF